eukprot:4621666-Pyramimonas_sp.AAC.1
MEGGQFQTSGSCRGAAHTRLNILQQFHRRRAAPFQSATLAPSATHIRRTSLSTFQGFVWLKSQELLSGAVLELQCATLRISHGANVPGMIFWHG